jgi:hypothetical protein
MGSVGLIARARTWSAIWVVLAAACGGKSVVYVAGSCEGDACAAAGADAALDGAADVAMGPAGDADTDGGGPPATACATISDCVLPMNPCAVAACRAGRCAADPAPHGTVVTRNVPADCHATVCDGMGGTTSGLDTTNAPAPTDPCTVPTCDPSGMVQSDPAPAGTRCDSTAGGQACDGAGNCLQCLTASDCPAGLACVQGRCANGCTNRTKDGQESDVDCGGGACPACADGKACAEGSDCASQVCDGRSRTCVAATCADHVTDGSETDTDCGGGACPTCADGAACARNADCASGECNPAALRCVPSLCDDQKTDGDETGVDCGGPTCAPCPIFQTCLTNQDCRSNNCESDRFDPYGVCFPSECVDGKQDGAETDRDCGGGECAPCSLGRRCLTWTDCASLACDATTQACIANHCDDHMVDGDETDVDCGDICAGCGAGQHCNTTADCATGLTCSKTTPHECH